MHNVRGLWIGKRGYNKEPGKKLVLVEYETGSVIAYEMNVVATDASGAWIPDGHGVYMRIFSSEEEKWHFKGGLGGESPLTVGRYEWTDSSGWKGNFDTTEVLPEERKWILAAHTVQFLEGAGLQFVIYT